MATFCVTCHSWDSLSISIRHTFSLMSVSSSLLCISQVRADDMGSLRLSYLEANSFGHGCVLCPLGRGLRTRTGKLKPHVHNLLFHIPSVHMGITHVALRLHPSKRSSLTCSSLGWGKLPRFWVYPESSLCFQVTFRLSGSVMCTLGPGLFSNCLQALTLAGSACGLSFSRVPSDSFSPQSPEDHAQWS